MIRTPKNSLKIPRMSSFKPTKDLWGTHSNSKDLKGMIVLGQLSYSENSDDLPGHKAETANWDITRGYDSKQFWKDAKESKRFH